MVQETGRISLEKDSGSKFNIVFYSISEAFSVVIKTDKGDITIKFDAATVKALIENARNNSGSGQQKRFVVVTGTGGQTFL